MSEHMGGRIEFWLIGADINSLWQISPGGPWTGPRIDADAIIHAEVLDLLAEQARKARWGRVDLDVIHSTSWRQAGPAILLTYIAVARIPEGGYVQDRWRAATPLTRQLMDVVGKPRPHGAARPPVRIRFADVLNHALRHLEFLRQTDRPARDGMSLHLRRHLAMFEPGLAGLYEGPLLDENGDPTAPGWAA